MSENMFEFDDALLELLNDVVENMKLSYSIKNRFPYVEISIKESGKIKQSVNLHIAMLSPTLTEDCQHRLGKDIIKILKEKNI